MASVPALTLKQIAHSSHSRLATEAGFWSSRAVECTTPAHSERENSLRAAFELDCSLTFLTGVFCSPAAVTVHLQENKSRAFFFSFPTIIGSVDPSVDPPLGPNDISQQQNNKGSALRNLKKKEK